MRYQFAAAQFVVEWQHMPIARELSLGAIELCSLDRREEAREKALSLLARLDLGGRRGVNTCSSVSNSNHFISPFWDHAFVPSIAMQHSQDELCVEGITMHRGPVFTA
jgi:hypothetical protein